MQKVKSGVPQGSVLWPVLFLLFINDLPLYKNTETELFADDMTIHAADKEIGIVENNLQTGALGFQTWCTDNKMLINYNSKTYSMNIGSRHATSNNDRIKITLEGHDIETVEAQKLLGIIIDKQLSWEQKYMLSVKMSLENLLS